MRFFCAYIPLLGLNGITECFFFALMSQSEIDRSVCAGRAVSGAISRESSSFTVGTTRSCLPSLPFSLSLLSC